MASRRSPLRRLALGLAGLALAVWTFGSCGSLPKSDMELELRALGKNQAMGALQRLPIQVDFGEGPVQAELVYHRAASLHPKPAWPVVLIHSTPSTLFTWTELIYGAEANASSPAIDGLRAERDVYAIEIIGHGIAPGNFPPFTFERCAEFITAALDALDLKRVHIVGSSYGGEFAWRAALNSPARFASVSLLDSSGIPRRAGDWLPEEVVMRDNPLAKLGWRLNSRERIEVALAPHFRTLPPDRVEEFFLVCSNALNWSAMIELVRDENGARAQELTQLKLPTLLLWGAQDIAYPVDLYARRFMELLPQAQLVALENCGHYPHEERPEQVIRELSRFFAEQESEQ